MKIPAATDRYLREPSMPDSHWLLRREGALNWLALGVLLAAWNATEDAGVAQPRPTSLEPYPQVSVRAVRNVVVNW